MDIDHEPKNLGEPLDINQAVNDLIEKTITIIESSPEDASNKQIRDIKDALENLKGVDKTLNYELFPETKEKLEKLSAETPELDEKTSKDSKEVEEVGTESEKNTEEVEEPTEADRKKYNEIIDEKLDHTIKTLEEIEEATNVEGKTAQEIEASRVLSGKIAKRVALEFLSNGVKKFAQVHAPVKEEEKTSNEMDLNPVENEKNNEPIENNSYNNRGEKAANNFNYNETTESSKNVQDVDAYSTTDTEKNNNDVDDNGISFTTKNIHEVGIVNLINEEINSKLRAAGTEVDEPDEGETKENRETPDPEIITSKDNNETPNANLEPEKIDNPVEQATDGPDKENRDIQSANEGPTKEANEFTAVKGEDKTQNDIDEADEGDSKNQNDVTTTLGDGKTETDIDAELSITEKNTEEIEETQIKTSKSYINLANEGADPKIDDNTPRKGYLASEENSETQLDNTVFRGDNSGATVQSDDRKSSGTSDSETSGTQLYGSYNKENDEGNIEEVEYDAQPGVAVDNREGNTKQDFLGDREGEKEGDVLTGNLTSENKGSGPELDTMSSGESKPGGPGKTGTSLQGKTGRLNDQGEPEYYDARPSSVEKLSKGDIIGTALQFYFLLNLTEVRRDTQKYTRQMNTEQTANELTIILYNLGDHKDQGVSKYFSLSDDDDKSVKAGQTKIGKLISNGSDEDDTIVAHRDKILKEKKPESKRSFKKSNHPNSTGYLRIYTKRAVDMEGTLSNEEEAQTKIIPFQFEPGYSGDSKKAEYSSIGTLGRSGAAKVYTKSQERSIQLTLDYVVTGPKIGDSRIDAESESAKSMADWSEDYIYNFIVPNFRNLVKPNVGDSKTRKFRLGPPIIQVWYGGLNDPKGTSTGREDSEDSESSGGSSNGQWDSPGGSRKNFKNVPPAFLTTWMTDGKQMTTYRSLWLPQSVDIEYSGGIINNESRNKVRVTIEVSLVEIGPSVTANEILNWWDVTK